MKKDNDDFFIGWSNHLMPAQAKHLGIVAAVLMLVAGAVSTVLSTSISDPARSLMGESAAPQEPRDATLVGTLTSQPYPLLMIAADAGHPNGHGVMLAGDGKRAAAYDRSALEGRRVEVKGLLLKRGALDMLVLTEALRLSAAPAPADNASGNRATHRQALGRWRVVGEICDGKCGAGIMSPGTGIAHKACASLCIIGGVPPVLVITSPLAGHEYLMIGTGDGHALDTGVLAFVGMRIEVEGEVERIGDVALIRIEPGGARRL